MDIHSLLSKLLWLFVAGHVSMALMHMRAGNRPFARIAPFSINIAKEQDGLIGRPSTCCCRSPKKAGR